MNRILRISAAAAALALAVPASAQQSTSATPAKVGIGIGFTHGPMSTGTEIFVPINVSPNLRVEPLLGFDSVSLDDYFGKQSETIFGAGLFWVGPLGGQAQLYAGGRLALHWVSQTAAGLNPDKAKRHDTLIGAVLGAEYLPHPRVALGAEGMVGHVFIGDTEVTDGVTGVKRSAGSGDENATQGMLFVRIYIF